MLRFSINRFGTYMAQIKFDSVTFRYGGHTIFEDFSLTVDESQILGVVGPSGCGKTTLIRCLCGFIKPEKGEIYIGDTCVFSAKKRINVAPEKRNIGVVFQDYAVWPHMTVWENIVYPMKKKKMPKDEIQKKAEFALSQVRMEKYKNHLPSQLSGGQQQRVAIARSLVSSDDVIVLDEPITNLDAKLREEMLVEIRQIQRTVGTTILYITHDQQAALQLCDKIAVMNPSGALSQIGTDEEILLTPADKFVFTFIGVSNFIPVKKKSDGMYFDLNGKEIRYADVPESALPSDVTNGEYDMGIRPSDIVFDETSSVRGTVKSSSFLGSESTYFVDFEGKEIRVEQGTLDMLNSREYVPGDVAGLKFINPKYYAREKTARAAEAV